MSNQLLCFEFELCCHLKKPDKAIELIITADLPLVTWQRCADILMQFDPDTTVTTFVLEKTLEEMFRGESFNFRVYLRWVRVLLQTYLTSTELKPKCHDLVSSVLKLITCPIGKQINEELTWVAIALWNQGTEYWSVGDSGQGKAWCEQALTVATQCESCPELQFIRKAYHELLSSLVVEI